MAAVEIYTAMLCPYCHRAKTLLSSKGVDFTEIDVTFDSQAREAMMERASGQRTVPQVFIDRRHVGGSDELRALDESGELDRLLGHER